MKLDTYEVELIKQHKGEYVNRVSYQGWMRPPLATVQLVDQVRLSPHRFNLLELSTPLTAQLSLF